MLIVQVRTPKVKLPTHRAQNSQPTVLNSNNFNSFQEYFKSQSKSTSQDYSISNSRSKVESAKIELKKHHAHKASSQSTTISLTNSTSRNYGISKKNQKSNSSLKQIDKVQPKTVNPFQEDEQTVNQKLQQQLTTIAGKTKDILEVYESKQRLQLLVEQKLQQEIISLKKIIENQRKLLIKNHISIPIY